LRQASTVSTPQGVAVNSRGVTRGFASVTPGTL